MKKKHEIYLIIILTLVTGSSLSFYIANSNIVLEIDILWKKCFPKLDRSKYLKNCSNQAANLEKEGRYFKAIKILKKGLEKADNEKVNNDLITGYGQLINLFVLANKSENIIFQIEQLLALLNIKE